jgi:hypothetical protein
LKGRLIDRMPGPEDERRTGRQKRAESLTQVGRPVETDQGIAAGSKGLLIEVAVITAIDAADALGILGAVEEGDVMPPASQFNEQIAEGRLAAPDGPFPGSSRVVFPGILVEKNQVHARDRHTSNVS